MWENSALLLKPVNKTKDLQLNISACVGRPLNKFASNVSNLRNHSSNGRKPSTSVRRSFAIETRHESFQKNSNTKRTNQPHIIRKISNIGSVHDRQQTYFSYKQNHFQCKYSNTLKLTTTTFKAKVGKSPYISQADGIAYTD